MSSWIDLWETILFDEMGSLSIALGAVAILSLFELVWSAEQGHTARGRLRNLAYLVIFKVLGVGGVALWFAFGPRLPLGLLTPWLCGPQAHRVHHSRLPEHRDRNFAQFFPVIDRVLGTYHAPARDEFPPTGTETLATDAPIARAALWRPFQIWGELLTGERKHHG